MDRFFACNLCESLCGLKVSVEENRVTAIRGDPDDVHSRGHICPKAHALGELLDDPDRLRAPMIRDGSTWRRASWDEALARATEPLRTIRRRHGVHAVGLYVGNPVVHSHRASLAAELLTLALGTHNRFDPNSQDSNPRLFASMQVFGDVLSIPVPDVDRTRFLLMLGANPAVSNGSQIGLGAPRTRLRGILERGGRVVVIDPRRTETAAWASAHHFIRPGGDAALLLAMLQVVFSSGRVHARAHSQARGLPQLRTLVEKFPPERVAHSIGIPAEVIRALAHEFSSTDGAAAYARVGVCQSEFGALACWLVDALNVVTGNMDRPGGVMFPSPPADVAPLGRVLLGKQWARWRSRVRGLPEFLGALPSSVMAEEMETPGPGQMWALVCLAGNPVLTTPNGPRLARALEKLEHVVAIDFYINETTRHAHVILPPRHVFETGNHDLLLSRFTVRNLARYSAPILRTPDDTRDDWEIAWELALRVRAPRLGFLRGRANTLPEQLLDGLMRLGPHKLTLDALRAAPHGLDLGPLSPSLRERIAHEDGLLHLAPEALVADVARLERWLDGPPPELVLVGRRDLRSNNSWMHNLPSLAKGPDRARLFIHPDDAARSGIVDGARVRVQSRVGSLVAIASVSSEMMRGTVSLPHGFGHQDAADTLQVAGKLAGANANALTDELLVDPVIGTSFLNGVPVSVAPLTNPAVDHA